jgi:hypothetical protein
MTFRFGDYFAERRLQRAIQAGNHKHRHNKSVKFEPLRKVVRITINDGGMELAVCVSRKQLESLLERMKQ